MWWMHQKSNLEKLINEGERILSHRYAGFGFDNIKLQWLVNGIKFAMGILVKQHPHYKPMIDAMIRYLNGSGKNVKIDESLMDQSFKVSLLKAVKFRIRDLRPNKKYTVGYNYGNYPSNFDHSPDMFYGEKINSPLRYVIGGFTENLWYEIDENGGVHVFCEFEDEYDFKKGALISLDLTQMGILTPKFKQLLEKFTEQIDGIGLYGGTLKIDDEFWDNLSQAGIAQPYKHYYKGEILSLKPGDIPGYDKPEELLNALSDMDIWSTSNMHIIRYILDNNIQDVSSRPEAEAGATIRRIALVGNVSDVKYLEDKFNLKLSDFVDSDFIDLDFIGYRCNLEIFKYVINENPKLIALALTNGTYSLAVDKVSFLLHNYLEYVDAIASTGDLYQTARNYSLYKGNEEDIKILRDLILKRGDSWSEEIKNNKYIMEPEKYNVINNEETTETAAEQVENSE